MTEDEALAQGYTLIKTAQDLDNIRNNLSGKYILMNDIDLSSYSNWDPIGEIDPHTGAGTGFTGILDGNGHVVKNLTITSSSKDSVGLFGLIGDPSGNIKGEVKNLGIENVDININTNKDGVGIAAGALAGASCCEISNCYSTGNIKIINSSSTNNAIYHKLHY